MVYISRYRRTKYKNKLLWTYCINKKKSILKMDKPVTYSLKYTDWLDMLAYIYSHYSVSYRVQIHQLHILE